MADLLVVAIIGIIVSAAAYKLWRDKKNGVKCAGCPSAPKPGSGKQCGCHLDD